MKKGFTVVELIASFTLAIIIGFNVSSSFSIKRNFY